MSKLLESVPSIAARASAPGVPASLNAPSLAFEPTGQIGEESTWIKALRTIFARWGQRGSVTLVTLLALVMSVSITAVVQLLIPDKGFFWFGIAIATVVPLLVAPFVSIVAMQLVSHLMQLEVLLTDQATRDALTGLPNRRWIMAQCQDAAGAEGPSSSPFGVLMIDIDHFKSINDRLGHLGGDLVLRAVAEELTRHLRPSDKAGRYGGEEFLVLTDDTRPAAALEIAQRLRAAVAAIRIEELDPTLQVTISVGVAIHPGGFDHSFQGTLHLADEALYRAKANGRNRVEMADAAVSRPHETA